MLLQKYLFYSLNCLLKLHDCLLFLTNQILLDSLFLLTQILTSTAYLLLKSANIGKGINIFRTDTNHFD